MRLSNTLKRRNKNQGFSSYSNQALIEMELIGKTLNKLCKQLLKVFTNTTLLIVALISKFAFMIAEILAEQVLETQVVKCRFLLKFQRTMKQVVLHLESNPSRC